MTKAAEERLARYLDGEVDPVEARSVEAVLRRSSQARRQLVVYQQIGNELRALADERGLRGEDTADRVMARVPVRRISKTERLWPAAFSAAVLAIAAGFALVPHLASSGAGRAPTSVETSSVPSRAPAREAEENVVAEAPTDERDDGASIESVDFGAKSGSIFLVSSGTDVTPVVWLVDEPAPNGARMKQL